MNKKIVLILGVLGLIILGIFIFNPFKQKNLSSPGSLNLQQSSKITPSKTLKTYTDPSGFSFNYPDNLSLLNNELKDESSYAELQLTATGVAGSLVLKIADSKLTSLDEWVKTNNSIPTQTPKEVILGNLKALEIKNNDEQSSSAPQSKLMLGALDQGILFTIEIPQDDFWREVLNIMVADFSFAPPVSEASSGDSGSPDVTFDGEEVVE